MKFIIQRESEAKEENEEAQFKILSQTLLSYTLGSEGALQSCTRTYEIE